MAILENLVASGSAVKKSSQVKVTDEDRSPQQRKLEENDDTSTVEDVTSRGVPSCGASETEEDDLNLTLSESGNCSLESAERKNQFVSEDEDLHSNSGTDEVPGGAKKAVKGPATAAPLFPFPSVGSASHFTGECKRCLFFPKGICRDGADCLFCHLEPHEEKLPRTRKRMTMKEKRAAKRAALLEEEQQPEKKAQSASVDAAEEAWSKSTTETTEPEEQTSEVGKIVSSSPASLLPAKPEVEFAGESYFLPTALLEDEQKDRDAEGADQVFLFTKHQGSGFSQLQQVTADGVTATPPLEAPEPVQKSWDKNNTKMASGAFSRENLSAQGAKVLERMGLQVQSAVPPIPVHYPGTAVAPETSFGAPVPPVSFYHCSEGVVRGPSPPMWSGHRKEEGILFPNQQQHLPEPIELLMPAPPAPLVSSGSAPPQPLVLSTGPVVTQIPPPGLEEFGPSPDVAGAPAATAPCQERALSGKPPLPPGPFPGYPPLPPGPPPDAAEEERHRAAREIDDILSILRDAGYGSAPEEGQEEKTPTICPYPEAALAKTEPVKLKVPPEMIAELGDADALRAMLPLCPMVPAKVPVQEGSPQVPPIPFRPVPVRVCVMSEPGPAPGPVLPTWEEGEEEEEEDEEKAWDEETNEDKKETSTTELEIDSVASTSERKRTTALVLNHLVPEQDNRSFP